MSLPIRVLTVFVTILMAMAFGFLIAWQTKLPAWGIAAAAITMVIGALYGSGLGLYLLLTRSNT